MEKKSIKQKVFNIIFVVAIMGCIVFGVLYSVKGGSINLEWLKSADTKAFIETNILPYVSALILAISYCVPMGAKYGKFANGLTASFKGLQDANDKTIEENIQNVAKIKEDMKGMVEAFKEDVKAMPISEIKELIATLSSDVADTDRAIVEFQSCFISLFNMMYTQGVSSPIYSMEEKEKMRVLYENAIANMSKADLGEVFKRIKEKGKVNEVEIKEDNN